MTRSLSIGIVTPTISRAGGGIFPIALAHARELTCLGHQVAVYGLNDDPEGLDRELWKEINLHLYWKGPLGYSPLLSRDLEKASHDLLHQHGLWMYHSIAVSRWRGKTGRPVVISTQGMLEPWALANSAWKKRVASAMFERRNVRSASAIHCSEAEFSGVHSFSPSSAIAVLPNGSELPDLERPPPAPRDLFPANRRTLLFFGRIHPKKGVAELLEAWAILKNTRPEVSGAWRLVVAGWDDGGHAERLKNLANSLNLQEDEVAFPGPRFGSDKAAILAHADAFVLPSFSEGFPMAVLEAWAYSLPVFMTRECNVPEGFHAQAAIEIKNEPERLAKQLVEGLSTANLSAIGASGRRLVEESYSWPRIVSDIAATYRWLVDKQEKPRFVFV